MYLFSVFLHACVPQLMCDCQATMCEDRLFPSLLCVLEMEVRSSGLATSSLIHPATLAVPSLGSLSQWFSMIKQFQRISRLFFGVRIDNECGKTGLLLFTSVCGFSPYPTVEQRLGHTTYRLFFTTSQVTQRWSPNYDSVTNSDFQSLPPSCLGTSRLN